MSDTNSTIHQPKAETVEAHFYGRLWPDGTFNRISGSHESAARRVVEERIQELKHVPKSLRPVFARQRVVTTTETYAAESLPEARK